MSSTLSRFGFTAGHRGGHRRPTPRAILVFAVATLTLSCTAREGPDNLSEPWRATVDTIGDTIVVHTVSGSVWGDTTRLEAELTIGTLDGPEEEIFGTISAIAVNRAGDIYVLDRQVPVVRKFGRNGAYLGQVGRGGGGPGEYRRPASLVIHPDGRLLLRDEGNGRINVYGPDDSYVTAWRLPSGSSFSTSTPMYVDTAGNTYTPILLQSGVDVTQWRGGLARFTPAGEHSDTIAIPTWDFEPWRVVARREEEGGGISSSASSVPFGPSLSSTMSPLGYLVGGVSTDYRIDLLRHGEPVLRIERDWTPVPVLAAEKEERERRIVENFRRMVPGWKWNGPPIPEIKPPFGSITVDEDGRLWVSVRQPGYPYRTEQEAREEEERTGRPQMRYRERAVFDVFDAEGRFLGPVTVPEDFQTRPVPVARGDTVWAVTRDELGVPRVVRYRMVRGKGSG